MPERRLPYGRHSIDEEDIAAVVEVLRGDWLTTGPHVDAFERQFAAAVGAEQAVAVNSGTAALHCALHAAGIGPGDEVLVPALTFAATANAVVYCGARPVFVDVAADTLLIDPRDAERKVTPRTKGLVAVDYAGQPCDYDALRALAEAHRLALVADACHALGARYRGRPVGALADLSTFSFHPVKHLATGEGGMITTASAERAQAMRRFRNHGLTSDHRQREAAGSWFYEMVELGHNYRLTDLQCALGSSQLRKLCGWVERRQAIAARYRAALADAPACRPLAVRPEVEHAWHLFVVRVAGDRKEWFVRLRGAGIGVNVHYVPVHLHPYYRQQWGTEPGLCPVAEEAYEQILSLPMYPTLTDDDVDYVIDACQTLARAGSVS
jgi:perosamine synthetase